MQRRNLKAFFKDLPGGCSTGGHIEKGGRIHADMYGNLA